MDDPGWTRFMALALLFLLSSFFAMVQAALFSLNTVRLTVRMRKRASDGCQKALCFFNSIDRYEQSLFTVMLGILLTHIGFVILATNTMVVRYGRMYATRFLPVVFFVFMLFSGILPHTLGRRFSEPVVLAFGRLIRFFMWLFSPFHWFFKLLLQFGAPANGREPAITEDDLHYLIGTIGDESILEQQERELVQSALEFDDISVGEILTPRVNIIAIDIHSSLEEIKQMVLTERYSRIPVYDGSIDSIVGILYTRDFLCSLVNEQDVDIRTSMGEPLFAHRSMPLSQMLAELQATKMNLAVVTDDYGGTLGIVTMEDILEELVGEIWDEDDEIPEGFVRISANQCEVSGEYDLQELFDHLGLTQEETDYTTVNGWAMHVFEHIPSIGEQFVYENKVFTVLETTGHRIKKLGIANHAPEAEEAKT